MADRPINLYQHEVRAVLAGRQTQLRRVLKPQPVPVGGPFYRPHPETKPAQWHSVSADGIIANIQLLRVAPGDRLWVRETWKPHSLYAGMKPRDIPKTNVFYLADDRYAPSNTPWIAAPQMPRWASRITLLVDEVRVQRLQEISEEDALAHGLLKLSKDNGGTWKFGMADLDGWPGRDDIGWPWTDWSTDYRAAFSRLWGLGPQRTAWDENPWVEVRTFRTVLANIDEVTK